MCHIYALFEDVTIALTRITGAPFKAIISLKILSTGLPSLEKTKLILRLFSLREIVIDGKAQWICITKGVLTSSPTATP
jgi:hypothetical protein